MVSVAPDAPGFGQALELATKALGAGEKVYVKCFDDACELQYKALDSYTIVATYLIPDS